MIKKILFILLLPMISTGWLDATEIHYDRPECWQQNPNVEFQNGVFTAKGMLHFFAANPIKVEKGKHYTLTGEVRNPDEVKLQGICLAVIFSDQQGKQIHSRHYMNIADSETILAAPTHINDTSILVQSNPQWKMHPHWALTVAFDIQADASDLPNPRVSTKIIHFMQEQQQIRVTLEKPLFAEFAEGTRVRLHHQGSFYLPCPTGAWYNFCGKDWKVIGGPIQMPANAVAFIPAVIYYDHNTTVTDFFELRAVKLTIE
ncbi:MAG: hypothetical protein WCT05_06220 [Lentisphaeria bacterium]